MSSLCFADLPGKPKGELLFPSRSRLIHTLLDRTATHCGPRRRVKVSLVHAPVRSSVEPRASDPNKHVLDRNNDGNRADHDILVPVV